MVERGDQNNAAEAAQSDSLDAQEQTNHADTAEELTAEDSNVEQRHDNAPNTKLLDKDCGRGYGKEHLITRERI